MSAPALRFKAFSDKWKAVPFGDIFTFRTTNSYSRECLNYSSGKVKNIHYGDIHTQFKSRFYINRERVPFVNEEIDLSKISSESYCKEGDLVIADASEDYKDIGKCIEIASIDSQPVIAGLHTFLARPSLGSLYNGFIGYAMQSNAVRLQIMTIAQGTKVLSISTGRLSKVKVPLPSIEEQTKIANFLTVVDEKITQLTQKHELLAQYKKGVMQQIFSQALRFKDDNGQDFPEWETLSLGDIATRVTRKNKENNLNVLTISAQQGLINQEEYFHKSVSAKDVTNYYLLHMGDFAYNKSYSKGYPMGAIKCLNRYKKGVVSTLYICFKFNDGNINAFFEHYFEAGLQNAEIDKVAQEGARNHGLLNIGLNDFFSINLTIPSIREQEKIAKFLTAIEDKLLHAYNQLTAAKQYKQGLLQQMFV